MMDLLDFYTIFVALSGLVLGIVLGVVGVFLADISLLDRMSRQSRIDLVCVDGRRIK